MWKTTETAALLHAFTIGVHYGAPYIPKEGGLDMFCSVWGNSVAHTCRRYKWGALFREKGAPLEGE